MVPPATNQLFFNFGTAKLLQILEEQPEPFLGNMIFGKLKILQVHEFENVGTEGGPNKPEDPFNQFVKLLTMGSRFLKHDGYLVLNMGSRSSRQHEMEIL